MTADEDVGSTGCSNPECQVATTGVCPNGLELNDCPQYAEYLAGSAVKAGAMEPIAFHSGDHLSTLAARALLHRHITHVIAIIGPFESGKTSLVAAIYDLFQTGHIGGIDFVDSLTLHALERASHYSRLACGGTIPASERTSSAKGGFFHLDVSATNDAVEVRTLLLGDRSGELYSEAADNVLHPADFPELERADTITLLVDGARLADLESRDNVIMHIDLMLRALVEASVTSLYQQVALVLTKLDAVMNAPDSADVLKTFEGLSARLNTNFREHFSNIVTFRVAAAPKNETATRGTGVAEVLKYWLEPRISRSEASFNPPMPTRAIELIALPEEQ